MVKLLVLLLAIGNVYAKDVWNGDYYALNSALQFQWAADKLKKLNLKGNESILDIGCGDGRFTEALAYNVPNGSVIGIDASTSMLASAKKLLTTHVKNLSFIAGDIKDLNFENKFDLAVSFSVFHWVSDHLQALKSIERALKPGGRAFIYFAPEHGRYRFDTAINYVTSMSKWKSYFENFKFAFHLTSPSEFAKHLDKAKLLFKRIEIIKIDEIFANKTLFMQWLRGWMPHLKHLPHELQKDFMQDVINKYLETNPLDESGRLHYYDYRMEVEAEKPLVKPIS